MEYLLIFGFVILSVLLIAYRIFLKKRKSYRTEVNSKVEELLGFNALDLFPVLSYADHLDKAYMTKFSTTSASFYVLILFYVSAIECGGDSSKQATLLNENGLTLDEFLAKILNSSSYALLLEPDSRADIVHLLTFINKARTDFGYETVSLPL